MDCKRRKRQYRAEREKNKGTDMKEMTFFTTHETEACKRLLLLPQLHEKDETQHQGNVRNSKDETKMKTNSHKPKHIRNMTWNDIYDSPNHEADLWCVTLTHYSSHLFKKKIHTATTDDTLLVSILTEYSPTPISFYITREKRDECASKITCLGEDGRTILMVSVHPNPRIAIAQLKLALRQNNPSDFDLQSLEDLKYNLLSFNKDVKTLRRFIKEKGVHMKYYALHLNREIENMLHSMYFLDKHKPRFLPSRLLPLLDKYEDHKFISDWGTFFKRYGTTRTT